MKNLIVSLLTLVASVSSSQASFHFWDIQEVYSNANGSVQFIELFTTSGGQQFLGGHSLASTGSTTFNFSDLALNSPLAGHPNTAGTTANQTFLLATSNFASLYNIVPDYVIPANFLTAGTGKVLDFGSGTDVINLTSLPTNGVQSLNADISSSTSTTFTINANATPKNFRGETVVIPEPTLSILLAFAGGLAVLRHRR